MTMRSRAFLAGLLALFILPLAGDRAGALRALLGEAHAAVDSSKDKNYDLTSLDVLRKSVVQVKDNYVDPGRINPKEMFVAALEAVEKQVAEVMVEPGVSSCEELKAKEPGTSASVFEHCTPAATPGRVPDGKVRVTVGSATKEFDYSDVTNIWQIPLKMRDVFSFLKENMVTQNDQREIEYAAVNGMLSTLDPHSWLLKPELYKEMKVQTRGEFGGLGFVISMREDRLTVNRVLKNTPAFRAGVKRGDVITQIDADSTVSMDLQEAVDRMRGKPGTKVTIHVNRKGSDPRKLELTRDLITFETVTSKLLEGGVGYVKLASFSGTTTRDMQAAIRAMKGQLRSSGGGNLKGLILDLRGNPGGLLEQAIQVSDTFVEEGTIVTTVGMNGQLRDPKMARNDGGEREFPMAVLISSDSASASEIVAGALKNLNRAVIVGRQSFGKGSVQLLYDFPDRDAGESALKLTIAQYLTPGDISIQEVGITPDVELVPARILKDRIDLFSTPKTFREADYDKHFFNAFARDEEQAKESRLRATGKPLESLRYLREETSREKKAREAAESGQAPEEEFLEEDGSDDDGVTLDYQIEFCKELLGRATSANRLEQLQQMKPFVAEKRAAEQEKVKKQLEQMGLNWGAPDGLAKGQKGKLTGEVKAPRTVAGQTLDLVVTAVNHGSNTLYRLRGITKSDSPLLDRREFVFGKLEPGEKRTWTVPIKVPKYTSSRRDPVTVRFEDEGGTSLDELKGEGDLAELQRPTLAWSWHLQGGSGDGLFHKGEPVELVVDVKNTGVGQAHDAYAGLKNLAEDRMNVKKGRTKLGPIKPGETKTATFVIEAKRPLDAEGPVPLRLEIGDRDLWEAQRQKILLPVGAPIEASASPAAVKVLVDTAALAAATESSAKVAAVKKGAVLAAKGKVGAFYKVEVAKGQTAFLPAEAAKDAGSARPSLKLSQLLTRDPPVIKLTSVDPLKGGLEIDGDKLTLAGVAADLSGLRDLQIFVQHENEYRKVFFRTARKAGEIQAAQGPAALDFSADLSFKPGNSTVYLIAREDDELQTQRTVVVHRKTPAALADAKKGASAESMR
jgi:carboxyl-terminal processing protease